MMDKNLLFVKESIENYPAFEIWPEKGIGAGTIAWGQTLGRINCLFFSGE
jgi:hypothetical protein